MNLTLKNQIMAISRQTFSKFVFEQKQENDQKDQSVVLEIVQT